MPTQAKSFFEQLGQFEFRAKKKTGISATPRVMAGPHISRLVSGLVRTLWVSEMTPTKIPMLKPWPKKKLEIQTAYSAQNKSR